MQNSIPSRPLADKLIDLNDLRVFAYVASLASFSLAADALQIHKSSVSRSIARLETLLDTPLLQRTTRKVRLTLRGVALQAQCEDILTRINKTIGAYGDVEERFASALHGVHPVADAVSASRHRSHRGPTH